MIVTIQKSGVSLADGTAGGSVLVESLSVDGQRLVDVVTNLGASGILVFDRFTNSHTAEFDIEKQHASPEAAIYHALMQRTNVTGEGSFVFEIEVAGATHTFTALQCAWKTIRAKSTGVSTITTYGVEYGKTTYRAIPVGSSLAEMLRDPLLTSGPSPDVALFPPPWLYPSGLPASYESITLADMAA